MASATRDTLQQATVREGVTVNAKQVANLPTIPRALMKTLEYGMEGARPVCWQRVVTLRSEFEQVQKLVEVYVDRQINTLADTRYTFDSYCGETLLSVCTKA